MEFTVPGLGGLRIRAWGRQMSSESGKESSRGRPGQLTRESIVSAAARIPPEDFSLRGLAKALGVSSQSLYHYFPSKESISAAIADEIADAIPKVDSSLHWKAYIKGTALTYRKWLIENEYRIARSQAYDGIAIFRIAGQRSENLLTRFNDFLSVLVRDGFQLDQAVEVWVVVQNFLRRSDLHRALPGQMEGAWTQLLADLKLSEKGQYPALEGLSAVNCPDLEAMYERILTLMVEGIATTYGIDSA